MSTQPPVPVIHLSVVIPVYNDQDRLAPTKAIAGNGNQSVDAQFTTAD